MRIKDDLKLYHVGSEYVVVDMSAGQASQTQLFAMNEATASLWEAFHDCDFTAEQMVQWLCESYEVDADTARHDVLEMIDTWKAYGMIA